MVGLDPSHKVGCLWNKVEVNTNLRAPRTRSTSSQERQRLDGGERRNPTRIISSSSPLPIDAGKVACCWGRTCMIRVRGGGPPQGILGAKTSRMAGNGTELVVTDADACGMALKDQGNGLVGGRARESWGLRPRVRAGRARAYAGEHRSITSLLKFHLHGRSSISCTRSRAPARVLGRRGLRAHVATGCVGANRREREPGPGDGEASFGDTTVKVAVGEAVRAQGDSIELETEGIDPFDRNKGRDTAAACSARGWVPSVYMFLFSEENRTAVPWYHWMYILNRKPFEDVVNFKPVRFLCKFRGPILRVWGPEASAASELLLTTPLTRIRLRITFLSVGIYDLYF
ncbi:hypothetical protein K438DRAFT_1780201 [Mycena galopus ATCC 62051]|nr:hypothetical protein K438DRAFT_1780201 [Mycena galopus ATCC 62051]